VTDVSDEGSMDHLGEATREAFGAVHVVCLNAGVSPPAGPMDTLTSNDWRWTLNVNLWGVIHGLRVFLPDCKARDEGHFVVTASVAGLTSYPWMGAYSASKHAVVSIAETLYSELREAASKVTVSCLCPGAVTTQIGESERNRPKQLVDEGNESASVVPQRPGDLNEFSDEFARISKAPAEVAELVLAAVVEERFWIETDAVYRDAIQARHRAIEDKTDPPARGLILTPYLKS
jgi:NAD(P)-dependent dehydrogenase (short-subunit alcohol dehydrogenase family)